MCYIVQERYHMMVEKCLMVPRRCLILLGGCHIVPERCQKFQEGGAGKVLDGEGKLSDVDV